MKVKYRGKKLLNKLLNVHKIVVAVVLFSFVIYNT